MKGQAPNRPPVSRPNAVVMRTGATRPTDAQLPGCGRSVQPVEEERVEPVWCVQRDPVARALYHLVLPRRLDEPAESGSALGAEVAGKRLPMTDSGGTGLAPAAASAQARTAFRDQDPNLRTRLRSPFAYPLRHQL
jgi:hypothetical protein